MIDIAKSAVCSFLTCTDRYDWSVYTVCPISSEHWFIGLHNYTLYFKLSDIFVMFPGSIPTISKRITILSALIFRPGPYYTNRHQTPDERHTLSKYRERFLKFEHFRHFVLTQIAKV